jgi:hypothetical protein
MFTVPPELMNEITRVKERLVSDRRNINIELTNLLSNNFSKNKPGNEMYSINLLIDTMLEIPDILIEFDKSMIELSPSERQRRSNFIKVILKEIQKVYENMDYNISMMSNSGPISPSLIRLIKENIEPSYRTITRLLYLFLNEGSPKECPAQIVCPAQKECPAQIVCPAQKECPAQIVCPAQKECPAPTVCEDPISTLPYLIGMGGMCILIIILILMLVLR